LDIQDSFSRLLGHDNPFGVAGDSQSLVWESADNSTVTEVSYPTSGLLGDYTRSGKNKKERAWGNQKQNCENAKVIKQHF